MSALDDASLLQSLDTSDMLAQIRAFAGRLEEGLQLSAEPALHLDPTPNRVIVCGMGGSAVSGDIVRALAGDSLECAFDVSRSYGVPPGCDGRTLAFFCSYSGNTEETLSAFESGRAAGVQAVCLTSGGELAERARQHGIPLIVLPGGNPPRASFGYTTGALLEILAGAGLVTSNPQSLERALARLARRHDEWGPSTPAASNEAKTLAEKLVDRVAVFYGSSGRLALIAARWAAQLAENGKHLAYSSELPEMNHNEIVGWCHPQAALTKIQPVFLLDSGDHPAILRRAAITAELMAEVGVESLSVETRGDSWSERLLSLVLLGDYVSYYLALLNGEDPTPVKAIDKLKEQLGASSD